MKTRITTHTPPRLVGVSCALILLPILLKSFWSRVEAHCMDAKHPEMLDLNVIN
jgi:hypothetical protein